MKNELIVSEEKKPIQMVEEEISPIHPKVLKFSDNAEVDFLNNSISSNEYIYNPALKSTHSIKSYQEDKESNTSNFTVSKAPNVSCMRHGRQFLGVDTAKFKLICKMCKELNLINELVLSSELSSETSSDQIEEIFCNLHIDEVAALYCDDCKLFICQSCCLTSHKSHNLNLPSYISNKMKNNIGELLSNLKSLKPTIEENLEKLTKSSETLKHLKSSCSKTTKEKINKTGEIFKQNLSLIEKNFKNIFNCLDDENENVLARLLGLQKRVTKYIIDIKTFENKIDNDSGCDLSSNYNCEEICEMKKENNKLFSAAKKIITDSEIFLDFKTPNLVSDIKSKSDMINKEVKSFLNNLKIFENSVKNSVQSGTKNNALILRRFPKFSRKGLRYYKSSSLVLKADNEIWLFGLGLSGLYISSFKTSDPNSSIFSDINERGKIKIKITIKEYQNEKEKNDLSETFTLSGIVNRTDPSFLIHFNKAILLKSSVKYLITIQNLEDNPIIDLWTGEVNTTSKKEKTQKITCNVTNQIFYFYPPVGVESDFDEFNIGIIANLIYLKND